jgi:exonuclease III
MDKRNQPKENFKETIKICTHNVRGINRQTDQDNILQELTKQKIDIIGLSETKLTNRAATFSFKDQEDYKTFHTCDDAAPYSADITMLIHKSLAKNIHRVDKIEGHVLVIHLRFKGRRKLCIMQIYLPNDKNKSNKFQKNIQKIIKNEKLTETNIIVMGDFNAVNNPIKDRSSNLEESMNKPKKCWKPEIPLFPFLEDLGFSDIQANWEDITTTTKQYSHTWKNKNSSSRIDYIWTTQDMALNNVHSFSNTGFEHITNSDHTLLQVTLYRNGITNTPKKAVAKRRKPRIIFDLKNMDKEKWSKYAQEIESEFKKIKIEEKIQRARGKENSNDNKVDITLQEIWSSIERTLQTTGKRTIPTKNIKHTSKPILKDRGHTPSFKDLREITGICTAIKKL